MTNIMAATISSIYLAFIRYHLLSFSDSSAGEAGAKWTLKSSSFHQPPNSFSHVLSALLLRFPGLGHSRGVSSNPLERLNPPAHLLHHIDPAIGADIHPGGIGHRARPPAQA